MHRILIVGGGFGGVTVARRLGQKHLPGVEITLLTDRPWLEYYGVLYRLIRGAHPSQACIPLKMILPKGVTVAIDRATSVDVASKTVKGEKATYAYDTLVLGPGAEPAYFGIPGMKEHSFTVSHAGHALRLRDDIRAEIVAMKAAPPEERMKYATFAVIGAGATGVEMSGDMLCEARELAAKEGMDPSLVTVDLIEAADRVLPLTEPRCSAKTLARLKGLGVNVMLHTAVESAEKGKLILKGGGVIEAGMVLWTAGVRAHSLLATVAGMEFDKRGRAVVDERLKAKGVSDVFVVGDAASTKYAGMAQTAIEDGLFVANVIAAERAGKTPPAYAPRAPAYAIPAGPNWAAVKYAFIRAYGFPGYVLRRLADIHVYMLVMPWRYVHRAYFGTIDFAKYGTPLPKTVC
jgi:NADH dehydrogenase